MKFIYTFLVVPSLVLSAPVSHPIADSVHRYAGRQTPELNTVTDTLLFDSSMDNFQKARADQSPSELDWKSNGCTSSPDRPLGFDFLPSCQRHDFGYHNYKIQDRFTSDNKKRIDEHFLEDMRDECEDRGFFEKTACRAAAQLYYVAVSTLGKREFEVDE